MICSSDFGFQVSKIKCIFSIVDPLFPREEKGEATAFCNTRILFAQCEKIFSCHARIVFAIACGFNVKCPRA